MAEDGTALPENPDFSEAFLRDFEMLLKWRRDVRRFKTDPLPDGLLEHLLRLADLAPSVGNSQPWRIIVVNDPVRRASIVSTFEEQNNLASETYSDEKSAQYRRLKLAGLKEAPVHLAVFSEIDPEQGHGLGRATMPETLAYSTVSMIHTLWLAARSENVGLGWVSILDPEKVSACLDVKSDWQFIAYLCLGYAQEQHLDPELQRANWQCRTPLISRIFYQ